MTIVATMVLTALLTMKREWLVADRVEPRSRRPVAPAHTTRPHRTTAAVAAGAPRRARAAPSTPSRSWRSAAWRPGRADETAMPLGLAPCAHMLRAARSAGTTTDGCVDAC